MVALKSLVETHAQLRDRVMATGSELTQSEFQHLEADFQQWWEMATVLIEVGSTGATPETQAALSAYTASPARSRRITLASDDAKAASEALRRVSGQMQREYAQRSASLPDPEIDLSVLSLSNDDPNDQWRASTGRQDLSQRQLEVLRTMLRTPVQSRPSLLRGHPSPGDRNADVYTPVNRGPTPSSASGSGKFPDTPESGLTSATFPSPTTASNLAQPMPTVREGKVGKTGLAGLKDFLKSIKSSPQGRQGVPPISPAPTSSTSSTSATCLSDGQSQKQMLAQLNGTSSPIVTSPPPLPLGRRGPSPQKGETKGKRPNIRNIFRSSSGNWSDLVRSAPPGPAPPLPGLSTPTSATPVPIDRPKIATDVTVRPSRKSRVLGLGVPSSPSSSSPSSPRRPAPATIAAPIAPTVPPHVQEAIQAQSGRDRSRNISTASEMSAFSTISNTTSSSFEGDVLVALTPDNLPVLLDYLRQCEGHLMQWKEKAEKLGISNV